MQRRFPSLVLLSAALASSAAAADTPTLASLKPGSYKIEAGHTQVSFTLSHFGLSNYSGMFSGASGSLHLDPSHVSASTLEVSVAIDSVQTNVPKLTDELKDADWFDAVKYPQAKFVSTSVHAGAGGELTISGTFTLHGVTRPLTLKAHLVGAGVNPIDKAYTVGFEAKGVVKRTDFGVSKYAPAIGDEVELTIAGAFELQG